MLDLYLNNGRNLNDLAEDFHKQFLERKTTCGYIWQAYLIDILNDAIEEGLDADAIEDTIMSAESLMQEIEATAQWHAWKGDIVHLEIPDSRRLFIYRKTPFK